MGTILFIAFLGLLIGGLVKALLPVFKDSEPINKAQGWGE